MKKTILSLLLLPTLALSMTKLDTPYSATAHPELCRRTKNTFSDTEIIVPRGCISSPARLGALSAVADKHGFAVIKDGQETRVHNYDVDPVLRRANKKQLLHLLKQHRLRITQFDNDDFRLALSSELKGGGPLLAAWFYSGTKVACYGAGLAAMGGAIAATGGVAGVGLAVGGTVATAGASTAVAATAAGVTAAAANVGVGAAALGSVGAAAAGAGTLTGWVAAVEGASLFMGAVGAAIPFL